MENLKSSKSKRRAQIAAFVVFLIFISGSIAFVVNTLSSVQKVRSKLPIEDYAKLLTFLRDEGYTFVLPFENSSAPKQAIIIHDVDFTFEGAKTLAAVERSYKIRSVFFLRPSADWFSQSVSTFKTLEEQGWQVGLQQDCLSRSDGNMTVAAMLFKAQVAYMRSLYNVTLTTYHGDTEYNAGINNYQLYFEHPELWETLGLNEVYSLQGYSYIADTDAKLKIPEELSALVLVQIHVDWY